MHRQTDMEERNAYLTTPRPLCEKWRKIGGKDIMGALKLDGWNGTIKTLRLKDH